jgi:hypothetical protein
VYKIKHSIIRSVLVSALPRLPGYCIQDRGFEGPRVPCRETLYLGILPDRLARWMFVCSPDWIRAIPRIRNNRLLRIRENARVIPSIQVIGFISSQSPERIDEAIPSGTRSFVYSPDFPRDRLPAPSGAQLGTGAQTRGSFYE